MISSRFLPLITPISIFILFELIFFIPKALYVLFFLVVAIIFLSTFVLVKSSQQKEKWFNLLILPLYLCCSAVLLSIILPIKNFSGQFVIQSVFIITVILVFYYFRLIYNYLINPGNYRKNSLAYFSSYANFISVYLISSAAFGLQSFLSISIWLLMLLILLFVALTSYELMWANGIKGSLSYFYISFVCLLIFELSWAVSFLTLSYYILGLLIAITYYVIIGLIRFQLLKSLNKNIVKTYLTLGLVSIIVVLMTARWL